MNGESFMSSVHKASGPSTTRPTDIEPLNTDLVAVFAEVLGRRTVAPTDDFFDLGGDSLRATQVLARVAALYGVELRIDDFFANPTAEAASQLISAHRGRPSQHISVENDSDNTP